MSMNIPNVPSGKIIDDRGEMSSSYQSYFNQLVQYLQTNLSNEGLVAPSLTTAEIALLTDALNGTIVYNSTTGKLMGKEGGSFVNLV